MSIRQNTITKEQSGDKKPKKGKKEEEEKEEEEGPTK